ncbi:MAG: protein-glutamate O-methyltransferase family protein, partial [Deltaproteobacteria bacterium]|nr:protein-glutamate O-methyltransferase family protein [Deltaproteobacteria bacterium]
MSCLNELRLDNQTRTIYPDPRCGDCLVKLAEDVTHMIGEKVVGLEKFIQSETKRILADGVANRWTSPECANEILRVIRKVSGVADPYEAAKLTEMAQAKSVFAQVKDRVADDFRSMAGLAVLGNSLDFFRSTDDALADVTEQTGNDLVYFHDDLDRLQKFLRKNPSLVLYLTDNSGEIFFDFPLFQ